MTATAVESERIRTLYRQSVPVFLANVLIAGVVGAMLWGSAPRTQLVGWMVAVGVITALRVAVRHRYWKALPRAEEVRTWGALFVAGSAAAAALWGLCAVLFYDAADVRAQVMVTLAVAGMCAGAAGTLSCHLPAFYAYFLLALAPLAARVLVVGDALHLALGAMTVIYGLLLVMVARNAHRTITEAFRLRFENDALLVRLSATQRTLEETNRTLEQRVAERTAALERQSESLREAQRLESVGRLAAGIAHDFNNLLTVVLANITLLMRDGRLEPVSRTVMEEVQSAATRGADLVRQLLAFGRQQRLAPRVLDLNQVVEKLEMMLARLIGERVLVNLSLAKGRALVRADRGQLEQVIVNLVTNARDAMPNGGRLTVETALIEAEGDAVLPAGSYALLSVGDTGLGMDAETRRHIFEPFYTTKPFGKGTGLGLATVYGVVEQSGGHVSVESEPGAGTTFKIYLPRTTELAAAVESPPVKRSRTPAPATILLAEDDAEVRSAIERVLKQAGHQIMSAPGGHEALALSRAHGGAIHVLVTDVIMPQMGGAELVRVLARERPGMRVLFLSGYSPDGTVPPDDTPLRMEYLQKPVTSEALLSKVAALLDASLDEAEAAAAETRIRN